MGTKQTIIIDIDDFCDRYADKLLTLEELYDIIPNIKINLFFIPKLTSNILLKKN